MPALSLHASALGYEVHDGDRLVALYRAREELPRQESPKPCFAPIYTPSGLLVTEYRPADHPWHTGLYFGWVHANHANLWGGPWYLSEKGQYKLVEHTHGVQRHEGFDYLGPHGGGLRADERLTWVDADDRPLAREQRTWHIRWAADPPGYSFCVATRLTPAGTGLTLGASRAARYSGLELRMGPPFADAHHVDSEGRQGHEQIMGQQARWVAACGAAGGAVIVMDHPTNPRHPVTWFARRNLLGAGLLMSGDLHLGSGQSLELRYACLVLDELPPVAQIEASYAGFAA
ncbi:MAG: PmoA family protein [Candidatus Latescibacterota bacterium]